MCHRHIVDTTQKNIVDVPQIKQEKHILQIYLCLSQQTYYSIMYVGSETREFGSSLGIPLRPVRLKPAVFNGICWTNTAHSLWVMLSSITSFNLYRHCITQYFRNFTKHCIASFYARSDRTASFKSFLYVSNLNVTRTKMWCEPRKTKFGKRIRTQDNQCSAPHFPFTFSCGFYNDLQAGRGATAFFRFGKTEAQVPPVKLRA